MFNYKWIVFYFPFHIWDVILPVVRTLHHFSRWLKLHQPDHSYFWINSMSTKGQTIATGMLLVKMQGTLTIPMIMEELIW